MPRIVILLAIAFALAACSAQAPESTASSALPAAAATNALAGTPMAGYGTALNKTKNVQNIVDQQAAQQAAAISAATASSSD